MLFKSLRSAQTTNDFSVHVSDRDWKTQWVELVSAHTERVDVNLIQKTATLHIRQLKEGVIQEAIFHTLSKDPEAQKIDEVRVRPARGEVYEYIFTNGRLVNHHCAFDYKKKEPVVHTLALQFEQVELKIDNREFKLKRA